MRTKAATLALGTPGPHPLLAHGLCGQNLRSRACDVCGSVTDGATQHITVEPDRTTERVISEGTQEAGQERPGVGKIHELGHCSSSWVPFVGIQPGSSLATHFQALTSVPEKMGPRISVTPKTKQQKKNSLA